MTGAYQFEAEDGEKAIFSADVQGYSKLMGDDDEHTVETITAYRETISQLIENHHGRVVDAPGDNILAMFDSSLNAIQSAIEIQERLKAKNERLPENRRMNFRIGINLGDILHKDDRIYGDGVNIAARIEDLADPGGICISRGIYEQIDGKFDFGFSDRGPHQVKNIKKPVNIFKVLIESNDSDTMLTVPKAKKPNRRWMIVAIVATIALIVGFELLNQRLMPSFEPASFDRMAYALPDKPSIAVLPFENYSDESKLSFFAKGLTENPTASLSKVPDLYVISKSSAATYEGKQVDIGRVAEEQGVQTRWWSGRWFCFPS